MFLIFLIAEFGLLTTLTENSSLNDIVISRAPKDYFPKTGSLQLICEAQGNPTPTVTWYDSQTMTPVNEEKSIGLKVYNDIGLLIIQNPIEREIYEFYCNVSNANMWRKSGVVRTGLAFLSSVFKQEPQAIQVVKPSRTVILFCRSPKGVPSPRIHWLKDGKWILKKFFPANIGRVFFSKNDQDQEGNELWSMKIMNVNLLDSGRYQCVASNDFGRVESTNSWLVVSDNRETSLNIKIENRFSNVNQDVTLLCITDHKGDIRWISSRDISFNNRISLSSTSLLIKGTVPVDNGIYACETNGTNSILMRIYQLKVGVMNMIEDRSKSRKKVVIEGVNVVLECDLENTDTEYYWETPNSQPLFPKDFSHSRMQVSANGNLDIKTVQPSDAGKYTCNVHSSLNVAHKSIWLEVSKLQFDIYPIISIPCQNLTILRGSNINLSCEVIGEDIVKFVWYKGLNIKQRLINTDRISFPSKDSIQIVNSESMEDSNFYTCEATNEQGRRAMWMSFVNVVDNYHVVTNAKLSSDLPLPPVVESPRNIKSTSLELYWSSNNNQDAGLSYWIEYVHFGADAGWSIYRKDWKKSSITITNLSPETWYQFLVRSKNEAGIGRASVPTEYVKTNSDEIFSGNIGFSFSKIKFHIPIVENDDKTRLTWSLNRIGNEDKVEMTTRFFLLCTPVSILQCIIAMSNVYEIEYHSKTPSLTNYCSLTRLTSDKLKSIKMHQSSVGETATEMPINFSKMNITMSHDLNDENYAKVTSMLPNLAAFHCFNVSVVAKHNHASVISNYRLVLTPETRPSRAPERTHVTWVLPESSIYITWEMPHHRFWNGVLTGSSVYMKSKDSEMVLKYNGSLSSKLIKRVNSEVDWIFQVSLSNCAGESHKSKPVVLKSLLSLPGVPRSSGSVLKKWWMIATLTIISLLIWVLLSSFAVYLCFIRSNGVGNQKHENKQSKTIPENIFTKDSLIEPILNSLETEKILLGVNEELSSSNNCESSAKSSSPSDMSFCNPYASTQLFEGVQEKKTSDLNLFYLSTPIFDSLPIKNPPIPQTFYVSNTPDWMANHLLTGSIQQNAKHFPFQITEDYRRNSNSSDIVRAIREKIKIDDNSIINTSGTINNLLISAAPFSDQFSASSRGKSTPNSSNSESTNQINSVDPTLRFVTPNCQSKPSRRRQDHPDNQEQPTEMTHLLIDSHGKNSPCIPRVYDTPYSGSSLDSRKNSLSKE